MKMDSLAFYQQVKDQKKRIYSGWANMLDDVMKAGKKGVKKGADDAVKKGADDAVKPGMANSVKKGWNKMSPTTKAAIAGGGAGLLFGGHLTDLFKDVGDVIMGPILIPITLIGGIVVIFLLMKMMS